MKEVNTMLKEVQMTFRVDPELRAEFSNATALADRPAAQVLRELMRAYVIESNARAHSPANDLVSPAESRRREKAVNFARACVGLEGFKPSEEAQVNARRFINGEIDLSEFVQMKPYAEGSANSR
ncbi:antitoxin VbhA family protein [Verminephrobacter eiseniae]|uniref:antitoxin VbhA family protein n=2 Tax=Verminephrobacter eiseniae TaxID=364317 RepID=UPI0022444139|nr:hypothetical protein [Verminephrobacter eiseniae]